MVEVLVWMAILLIVCWLLLKLVNRLSRQKQKIEEEDSQSPFRK